MIYGRVSAVFATGIVVLLAAEARAQQVTVASPNHSVREGFFETTGTQWGFQGKGFSFSFGGPGFANPPFGNPRPNAGINTGFGLLGGLGNGYFNFTAGQGFSQSLVSQTPMITLTNGQPGYFADQSVSPFVMGLVPVVGGFPMVSGLPPVPLNSYPGVPYNFATPQQNHRVAAMQQLMAQRNPAMAADEQQNPVALPPGMPQQQVAAHAMEPRHAEPAPAVGKAVEPAGGPMVGGSSSAGVAVPSVAEARRLHAAETKGDNSELTGLFQRALAAEDDGKPKVAKIYYEMVARRASGDLKQQALDKLQQLRTANADAAE